MTRQIGWIEAIVASLVTLLVGLGIISLRDVAKIRAAIELVRIEAALQTLPPKIDPTMLVSGLGGRLPEATDPNPR